MIRIAALFRFRRLPTLSALPAQAVLLVGSERDGYQAVEPANDSRFIAVFAHALGARRWPYGGASFPNSGRTLTDAAADASS
jgi:hypothetical protein